MQSLFAIRSGTFKTFTVNEQGEEQITGFHLPSDLLCFFAIAQRQHPSFSQVFKTSMAYENRSINLDELSNTMPKLKK